MKVPQSLLDYQKTCLVALQRCRSDVENLTARLQAAQVGEQAAQASLDATALAIEMIEKEPDISASSEPPPPPTEPLDRVELLPGWPPEPPSPEVESLLASKETTVHCCIGSGGGPGMPDYCICACGWRGPFLEFAAHAKPPEPPSREAESLLGDDHPGLPADWNKVQKDSPLLEVSKAPFRPGCSLDVEASAR